MSVLHDHRITLPVTRGCLTCLYGLEARLYVGVREGVDAGELTVTGALATHGVAACL